MNAIQKEQAAIRKFLAIGKALGNAPKAAATLTAPPITTATPAGSADPPSKASCKAMEDKAMAAIKAGIEEALKGQATLIYFDVLNKKLAAPCNCTNCKRRRAAPWN